MVTVKKYKVTQPYLALNGGLLEGPYWEKSRNTLRFVDIVKKELHFVDLAAGPSSHKKYDLDYSIGITADIEGNDDEIIFGGKRGYGLFNRKTGEHKIVKQMWNDEERKADGGGKPKVGKNKEDRMRSNDGAVDARGRFFVGAMNDQDLVGEGFTDEGILFRLDPDLSLHRVITGVTIPNGMSWSSDNKTMYFTDSPTGKITALPYDIETGDVKVSEGKPFFQCPYEGAVPDGHCRDEEGYFWIALFGVPGDCGKVVRVNTDGQIVAEVELPTRCVTCPVICGTELFVTTAAEQDPEKYPWSVQYQGAVFKVDVGVKAKTIHKYRQDSAA